MRLTPNAYQRRVTAAMSIYVVLLLATLPLARNADAGALKILCALAPVLPLVYVVWLMGQRIRHSDELEQRVHLIGLGAGAAVVSIVSLVSGFLAIASVLSLAAASNVLIWIFPLLMLSYSAARSLAARRYGSSGCDEAHGVRWPFLFLAGLFALVAACVYWQAHDDYATGLMGGMSSTMLVAAIVMAIRQRLRARQAPQ